jgi:hypothetical protein
MEIWRKLQHCSVVLRFLPCRRRRSTRTLQRYRRRRHNRIPGPARPGPLHTARAGRALFEAIKADLTAFGRHLGLLLGSAVTRWRRSKPIQGDKRTRTRAEGRAPGRTLVIVPLIKGIAMAALLGGLMITGGILWALHDRPIAGAPARSDRPSLVLETAAGRPLGRTGPLIGAAARNDFPDVLVDAVLSIEDRRFYRHLGVDPQGILRAARVNHAAGKIVEGGSTITQQLVKLRGAGREQTMERKLREAFAALWLDFRMDKDAILTEYLSWSSSTQSKSAENPPPRSQSIHLNRGML